MARKPGLRQRRGFGGATQQALKAGLFAAGLGAAAVAIGWPGLFGPPAKPRQATPEPVAAPPKVDLRRARLVGRTAAGRPYRITAETAEWVDEGRAVALSRPTASVVRPPGIWTYMRAQAGRYRLGPERLALRDDVRVYGGEGIYLETARLQVDLQAGQARTDTRLRGLWRGGRVRAAEGGRVTDWGARLALFGASELTLAPSGGPSPPLPRPPLVSLVPPPGE